jgi:succinate-acetate transporter protein
MPDLIDAQSATVVPANTQANPAPLGLAAFGLTTVVLSAINAGWLPPEAVPAVVPLAFAFGGLAQLVAGILEFNAGNTFGMVAFISYGMFWWWFALLQWTVGAGWLRPIPPAAGGFILLMWGVFTGLLWIVSFRLSKAVWSFFLLLTLTFFLLALGDFHYALGSLSFGRMGGYLGLLTGLDALFVAFLELLNTTAGRVIISPGTPMQS